MKKLLTLCAVLFCTLAVAFGQKNVYTTKAYSENNAPEKAVKTTITIDQSDGYIEIGGDDPEIFHITKAEPQRVENGSTVNQYNCSDNEAMDCTIKVVKNDSSTKIYFIYSDGQFYYTVQS